MEEQQPLNKPNLVLYFSATISYSLVSSLGIALAFNPIYEVLADLAAAIIFVLSLLFTIDLWF
jgi:hypothetical protein